MKKLYYVLFLILILAVGGYIFYKFKFERKTINAWTLVPAGTVAVYESDQLIKSWNALTQADVWKNLSAIPLFGSAEQTLIMADSLSGKDGSLDQLLSNSTFLLSTHVTAKNEFDFLFFIDVAKVKSASQWLLILEKLKQEKGRSASSRVYQNTTLNEIREGKRVFTYFLYKNVFVGSFTPFLVEDVVRCIQEPDKAYQHPKSKLNAAKTLKGDLGKVYVNVPRVGNLLGTFSKERGDWTDLLNQFADLSTLELKVTDHELLFNGFTQNEPADSSNFSTVFRGQKAQENWVKSLIPTRTAWVYHFTFHNAEMLEKNIARYLKPNESIQKSRAQIQTQFGVKPADFYRFMDGENALATLESVNPAKPDRLLYIRCNDLNEALKQFNKLAEKVSLSQKDTLLVDYFDEQAITYLNIPEFPAFLFGENFNGFEYTYYTHYGKYMILANSIETLRLLLNDIDGENTWGKSVKQNLFMESHLAESNISLMVNTSRFWSILKYYLSTEMAESADKYASVLKSFEHFSFQFSNLDQQLYTSVAIHYKEPEMRATVNTQYAKTFETRLKNQAITKPFVLRNHLDNSFETMVQDSAYLLYLIDKNGQVLWIDSIGSAIVSDIHQIDYYRNGKLQVVFATARAIYILDRNGDRVDQYPLSMPQGVMIDKMAVLDYDNSKNYRWLINDSEGNAYMFDKSKNTLEGWNPRKFNGRMMTPMQHIRARGKDFIVAMQTDGKVHLVNRRGEMQKGFPLDLKDRLVNPVFVEIGSGLDNTTLSTITDRGTLIQFNLLAKVLKNEQLYKPAKETTFSLVPDAQKRSFIIARQDVSRVSVLKRDTQLIFDKDYITTEQMWIQYYPFGSGKEVYAITDQAQDFTYIYDKDGNLVNFQPLESAFTVSVLFSEARSSYSVYSCFENMLSLQEFKLSDL